MSVYTHPQYTVSCTSVVLWVTAPNLRVSLAANCTKDTKCSLSTSTYSKLSLNEQEMRMNRLCVISACGPKSKLILTWSLANGPPSNTRPARLEGCSYVRPSFPVVVCLRVTPTHIPSLTKTRWSLKTTWPCFC